VPLIVLSLVLTVMVRELPLREHAAFEDASMRGTAAD
jgi:hypothetical protein